MGESVPLPDTVCLNVSGRTGQSGASCGRGARQPVVDAGYGRCGGVSGIRAGNLGLWSLPINWPDFPIARQFKQTLLALPLHQQLEEADIIHLAHCLSLVVGADKEHP